MVVNKNRKAIELIEAILSQSESVSPTAEVGEVYRLTTRMRNAIKTSSPPGSVYLDQMQRAFILSPDPSVDYLGLCDEEKIRRKLVNIMQALKDDLQSDSVYQSLPPQREGQDTDQGGSTVHRIGAMIGSPGDATQERQAITDTILRWNAVNGADKGIFLDPVKWETHATPGLEGRPQGMINEELIPMSDFLIAVFRVRAGSPTGKEISGTIEEIREFMKLGKYVAIYFFEGEASIKGLDPDQLKKVQEFKKEIQQHGIVESYTSVPELQAKLGLHLSAIVNRLESKRTAAKKGRVVTTSSRSKRAATALPTPESTAASKKSKRSAKHKKPGEGASITAVDASGQWVLLNTRFYEARAVRQNKDRTFSVVIHSRSAEVDAAMSGLRPHHYGRSAPISFAYANDAWIVAVKDVEMVSEGKGQLWTVTLTPQDVEYGGGVMEMALNTAGRHYSPDDIARLRAGRILLNDPPPMSDKAPPGGDNALLEGAMLESHIQGLNTPASAKACIIRAVYKDYKEQPRLFLQLARLAAIYFLKASGVVEQVRKLTLGPLRKSKVHVVFQGVRRKKYSNVEPTVMDLEGDCPLD